MIRNLTFSSEMSHSLVFVNIHRLTKSVSPKTDELRSLIRSDRELMTKNSFISSAKIKIVLSTMRFHTIDRDSKMKRGKMCSLSHSKGYITYDWHIDIMDLHPVFFFHWGVWNQNKNEYDQKPWQNHNIIIINNIVVNIKDYDWSCIKYD